MYDIDLSPGPLATPQYIWPEEPSVTASPLPDFFNHLIFADLVRPGVRPGIEHLVGLRTQMNQLISAQQEAAAQVERKFLKEMESGRCS
jgi:hypothetical protein